MEKVTLQIGSVTHHNNKVNDTHRPVSFFGEELVHDSEVYDGRLARTLYKIEDGRYVVYTELWSHWQGETTTSNLQEVSLDDLDVGGNFELLGRLAGLARNLTLDEALDEALGK